MPTTNTTYKKLTGVIIQYPEGSGIPQEYARFFLPMSQIEGLQNALSNIAISQVINLDNELNTLENKTIELANGITILQQTIDSLEVSDIEGLNEALAANIPITKVTNLESTLATKASVDSVEDLRRATDELDERIEEVAEATIPIDRIEGLEEELNDVSISWTVVTTE